MRKCCAACSEDDDAHLRVLVERHHGLGQFLHQQAVDGVVLRRPVQP